MTTKELVGVFVLGSLATFLVGTFAVIFEMFIWDMTDRISIDWSWRNPRHSTIIHATIVAAINAAILGGGFLAVWIAKG